MAERERKSKPLKQEPVEEDEKRYNWWHLGMWLVGMVAVVELMYLVSQFLSGGGDKIDAWFYYLLGGTTFVTLVFWFVGWMADRNK